MQTPDAKQWVEQWKRLGPILEKIDSEELRDSRYAGGLEAFLPLLDWCCARAVSRPNSGLVEQQRLFTIARQQEEEKNKEKR